MSLKHTAEHRRGLWVGLEETPRVQKLSAKDSICCVEMEGQALTPDAQIQDFLLLCSHSPETSHANYVCFLKRLAFR